MFQLVDAPSKVQSATTAMPLAGAPANPITVATTVTNARLVSTTTRSASSVTVIPVVLSTSTVIRPLGSVNVKQTFRGSSVTSVSLASTAFRTARNAGAIQLESDQWVEEPSETAAAQTL